MSPSIDIAASEFLQLVGHPLRWRLLGALARSDCSVQELTDIVGEQQNLVSYHLGKLRDERLVAARRSAADRRDSYYRIDLERIGALLSAAGGAIHPGLRLSPPAPVAPTRPTTILFVCTGNSARSPMAEALALARSSDGAIQAASAGSDPRPLHPHALRVMREHYGLDLSGHTPKRLSALTKRRFDWVISLCDRAREVCPEFPGRPNTVHWSIPNPASDGGAYARFRETAAELATRIGFLLPALAERAPQAKEKQ